MIAARTHTVTLVHAVVTSRIDCCNSVLFFPLKKVMDKLQRVQNAAASLVTGTRKYERGLSRLMHDNMNWLVIPQRVQYKLAVTVHRCLRHRAPRYLTDYCVLVSEVPGCQFYNLPVVINCRFRKFAVAPTASVRFLSLDQQSGIYCLSSVGFSC